MQKHATLLGAAALALTTSFAQAQSADTVIVTVGEAEITLGELIIARAQLPQQYAQLPDEVLWEGLIDQMVQQELLVSETSNIPLRVELALKNERRTLLASEAVNTLMQGAVTEEAIQAAYAERFDGADLGQEYNASHLLVETEEEALAALERVNSGEEFADVARDVSTGPTGPNGGNLGWFGTGQMVPEFEAAVQALEVGGVSAPVQTQFGWHIVTLNDSRVQEQPGIDALREELTRELQTQALDARIQELSAGIEITKPAAGDYDPALLSDMSLLEPK